ncbi:hypothetical protein BN2364_0579 [Alloalcanivorax xenomutans]|nr:hypothetical protein BN2364_0579 [Alloalcanivorax xenomutans]
MPVDDGRFRASPGKMKSEWWRSRGLLPGRIGGQNSRTRYKHVHVGSGLAFPGQTRSWNSDHRFSTRSETARFESTVGPLWPGVSDLDHATIGA